MCWVCLVADGGRLKLVHIEDDAIFERYIRAIGKIPGLDTELARTAIERQLLHEAEDYAEAVKTAFEDKHAGVSLETLIRRGHPPHLFPWCALRRRRRRARWRKQKRRGRTRPPMPARAH